MKKIFSFLLLSVVALCTLSCEKDEVGGTATENMAGEWYVSVDMIGPDGTNYGDYYGVGEFIIQTYNTNANIPTEMYVDDCYNFWAFKTIVDIDYDAMTFSSTASYDEYYGITVNVTDGKITTDGAISITGMPADAITLTCEFSDDEGWYYVFSGYRWTGFE
ncbi:MAG: lipid-binding protein [Rikenellaceae bacterium]